MLPYTLYSTRLVDRQILYCTGSSTACRQSDWGAVCVLSVVTVVSNDPISACENEVLVVRWEKRKKRKKKKKKNGKKKRKSKTPKYVVDSTIER